MLGGLGGLKERLGTCWDHVPICAGMDEERGLQGALCFGVEMDKSTSPGPSSPGFRCSKHDIDLSNPLNTPSKVSAPLAFVLLMGQVHLSSVGGGTHRVLVPQSPGP